MRLAGLLTGALLASTSLWLGAGKLLRGGLGTGQLAAATLEVVLAAALLMSRVSARAAWACAAGVIVIIVGGELLYGAADCQCVPGTSLVAASRRFLGTWLLCLALLTAELRAEGPSAVDASSGHRQG